MAGDPFFAQVLTQQVAAGTLKNSFTTAATVLNPTELVTLPPNFLKTGRKMRITVSGGISNVVTSQPTFTFQVMLGSVVAWSSGAVTTNTTANTLLPFKLVIDLRVDSIGSSTTAKFLGEANFTCAAMASGSTACILPVTSPAVGTGFDSTIANVLDFYVACSASASGNAIQIYDYCVELLN